MTASSPPPLAATLRRIERASGALATQSVAAMDEQLPWFRALPPDQRSWIMLVAQSGVAGFVEWLRHPGEPPSPITEVFGTAPPELARVVNLRQTVELVRLTVEVVEARTATLAAPGEEHALREAILRYSREVAFAAAQVYASVAETRGAWDARLEALVVDALIRGEDDAELPGRAASIGWGAVGEVAVVVGTAPSGDPEVVIQTLLQAARPKEVRALAGVHGDRLIVVLGNAPDPGKALAPVLDQFGPGPVVIGPVVRNLSLATASAAAAVSGLDAAPAWPDAPRPVAAGELLPERALAGNLTARQELLDEVYIPLRDAGSSLLETVTAYLDTGSGMEATSRELFIHANTVRYRLRRVADITGRTPSNPRDAFALRVALVLGRLHAD